MLKSLDLFGVEFPFRIGDYEKFQTKSGGCFFIIYIISVLFYFTFEIYEYFRISNYMFFFYDESFLNNSVNLYDQDFSFAFFDTEGYIENKELNLTSTYISQDFTYQKEMRKCTFDQYMNFTDKKRSIIKSNQGLFCQNALKNETITVDRYDKKEFLFQVFPGEKFDQNKTYKLSSLFPINNLNGDELEKVLGMHSVRLSGDYSLDIVVYLEKTIYISDDEIFIGKNETNIVTNQKFFDGIGVPRKNPKDSLVDIYLRQSNMVKVRYRIRKRLHMVLIEMISIATTLLANFKAIASIVNLYLAKEHIFANTFHLNDYNNENKINFNNLHIEKKKSIKYNQAKKPKNLNSIPKSFSSSKSSDKKENLKDLKNLKSIDKELKSMSPSNNNKEINQENCNLKSEDCLKKEESLDIKNIHIKEKLIRLKTKYPTLGGNSYYKQDPRYARNFFSYLCLVLKCKKKRLNEIKNLYEIISNKFASLLDLHSFIRKYNQFDTLENCLFDYNERILMDYIYFPSLDLESMQIENIKDYDIGDPEFIYKKFNDIANKDKKSLIEKKLLTLFKNRLTEM